MTSIKPTNENQGTKFAVVRLKPGDDLLGLFQLLIHNGFGEVSFVNNLSETIFPAISNTGNKSISPTPASKIGDGTSNTVDKVSGSLNKADTQQCLSTIIEQHRTQFRPVFVDNHILNRPAKQMMVSDRPVVNHDAIQPKRLAFDANHQNSLAPKPGSSLLPTMPSTFPGIPPTSSLNSLATAAAISTLTEAATPPYSLTNFFGPNPLSTTISSTPLTSMSSVSQYSPIFLAAAAAAAGQQQRHTVTVSADQPVLTQTSELQAMAFLSAAGNRFQPQSQQRITTSAYQQQQQLQSSNIQAKFSQQNKIATTKSPTASPRSSSTSSSRSNSQFRLVDGIMAPNCAPMPPGCATTQLRQRGQRSYAEDPSLYVACRLCKNKIMGSRISNLTNHVRRHSSMKQFQCCYCDYTHNEMAKVRLHMLHNHKDKDSQPIDNLSPEMQASWDLLMKECFPDHCQQNQSQQMGMASVSPQQQAPLSQNGSGVIMSAQRLLAHATMKVQHGKNIWQDKLDGGSQSNHLSNNFVQTDSINEKITSDNASPVSFKSTSSATDRSTSLSPESVTLTADDVNRQLQLPQQSVSPCVECGVYVNVKLMARHIRKCHLQYLLPFVCSMCGYDHAEHSKVKVHICLKHDDSPLAQVITRDLSAYAEHLIPTYFSTGLQDTAAACQSTFDQSITAPACDSVTNVAVSMEVSEELQPKTEATDHKLNTDYDMRTCKNEVGNIGCNVCRRQISVARMDRHARRHVLSSVTVFACPICGQYRTNSYFRIRRHLESKHAVAKVDVKPSMLRRPSISAFTNGGLLGQATRRCFTPGNIIFRRKRSKVNFRVFQTRQRRNVHRLRTRHARTNDKQRGATVMVSRNKRPGTVNGYTVSNVSKDNLLTTKVEADMESPSNVEKKEDLLRMCPLCAHWIQSDQLGVHLQKHISNMGSMYRCDLCEYAAPDPLSVQAHCLQCHQRKDDRQVHHDAQKAALLLAYANLCRGSTAAATAAAADG